MSVITAIETYVNGRICVVKVRTDDGYEGVGQTAPSSPDVTAEVLHRHVARYFLGRDPWDLAVLVDAAVRGEYKFLGPFVLRAVGGVDTALWDLQGRLTGQPVYKLLGGRARAAFPVYASSLSRATSPEAEVERLARAAGQHGFTAAKIKVGQRNGRDGEGRSGRTATLVPLMRRSFDDGFDLLADANGAYSPGEAVRVGRLLEDHGYVHYEEPVPSWELENLGRVTRALDVPVAAGEQEYSLENLRRIIFEPLADVAQADVCYVGGLSRARRVAEMADVAGVPFTPHCSNRSMIQVFTAHLVTSMAACFQHQEWSIEQQPPEFFTSGMRLVDGQVTLDDSPGWGVVVAPAFLENARRQVLSVDDAGAAYAGLVEVPAPDGVRT